MCISGGGICCVLDTGRRAPLALSLLALLSRRESSGSSREMSRETCDRGEVVGGEQTSAFKRPELFEVI